MGRLQTGRSMQSDENPFVVSLPSVLGNKDLMWFAESWSATHLLPRMLCGKLAEGKPQCTRLEGYSLYPPPHLPFALLQQFILWTANCTCFHIPQPILNLFVYTIFLGSVIRRYSLVRELLMPARCVLLDAGEMPKY